MKQPGFNEKTVARADYVPKGGWGYLILNIVVGAILGAALGKFGDGVFDTEFLMPVGAVAGAVGLAVLGSPVYKERNEPGDYGG